MATRRALVAIKGISEVKADKMLKAAREMVNVGFTTVRPLVILSVSRVVKRCKSLSIGRRRPREPQGFDHAEHGVQRCGRAAQRCGF
jgi:hypothetical protein